MMVLMMVLMNWRYYYWWGDNGSDANGYYDGSYDATAGDGTLVVMIMTVR